MTGTPSFVEQIHKGLTSDFRPMSSINADKGEVPKFAFQQMLGRCSCHLDMIGNHGRDLQVGKKEHPRLTARWNRSIELAVPMVDDAELLPGFRYDAIRMSAIRPFAESQAQLLRYLKEDNHRDLRQGVISGLSDVKDTGAITALLVACHDPDPKLGRSRNSENR